MEWQFVQHFRPDMISTVFHYCFWVSVDVKVKNIRILDHLLRSAIVSFSALLMYYPLTLWQAENTALEEPDQFQIPKLNPRPKDEDEKHNKITE